MVDVKDYGAVGDGVNDDTAAINSAISNCESGDVLYFPPTSSFYKITNTITVPSGRDVIMDGVMRFTSTSEIPALVIGNDNSLNRYKRFRLAVERSPRSDWSNSWSIGIRLINSFACDIDIMRASYFHTGVSCEGCGDGWVYNNVHLGILHSNKWGLKLINRLRRGVEGWVNENLFFGGAWMIASDITAGGRVGVMMTQEDIEGNVNKQNNNVFIKPSFELNVSKVAPGQPMTYPIFMYNGTKNLFYSSRMEDCGNRAIGVRNNSSYNEVHVGINYATSLIKDDTSPSKSTLLISRDQYVEIMNGLSNSLN